MQTSIRLSGHGTATVTINGLTSEQTDLLRAIITANSETCLSLSGSARSTDHTSSLILTAPADRLQHVVHSRAASNGVLADCFKKISALLDNYLRTDYKINCGGKILDLGSHTHIMGILNVTPDSFSDGGRYNDYEKAVIHAKKMVAAGADIIDIGGESTRPGATALSEDEECSRILPVIQRLSAELPVPLSVDTYKARVAEQALQAGCSMINDISGLRFSKDMAAVTAQYGAAVIIMHIKGTPRDMQVNPEYQDVVQDVIAYLEQGLEIAAQAGVDREKILLDPGIGFGKTLEHNLTLINRLDELRCLDRPLVLGTSRKKFIGTTLDIPIPEKRDEGTAATVALGIERGARIIRVHDVSHMVQIARMTDAILRAKTNNKNQITNNIQ
ncbi:MAG: dihydropteroate synthase [Nitrospirota bacterium]